MKKLSYLIIVIVGVLSFYSCNCDKCEKDVECEEECIIVDESSDYLINATLWVQQSAEYTACCYQSFNYAKIALDNNLKAVNSDKPAAVVFDIDETVLDNSYFEANLIETNTSYTKENWKEWSEMQCATPIPGAVDFINYVVSKGVEVVYITNRMDGELDATIENMKRYGFPEVPKENYFFRTEESSKVVRRSLASEKYNLILFLGDNLADFDGMFEDRSVNYGKDVVDANKEMFGSSFIMLPNPMYGKWERVLPKDEEKSARENRVNALINYHEVCE